MTRRMKWSLLLFLSLLLAVILQHLECRGAKIIDYAELEKAWEAGDEEQELRTEGSEHYRHFTDMDENEAKALGPQMIFVTIKDDRGEPLPDVASRWKEMLWNGGVDVSIYEVADSKLLVGLQKGVFVNDVIRFLDQQHDVMEYEWNGKAYSKHSAHHKHHHKETEKSQRKKAKKKGAEDSRSSTNRKHQHRKPAQSAKTKSSKTMEKRRLNDEL